MCFFLRDVFGQFAPEGLEGWLEGGVGGGKVLEFMEEGFDLVIFRVVSVD